MWFRVNVPGRGDVYVQAADQFEALQQVASWAGISPDQITGQVQAVAAGSIPPGAQTVGGGGSMFGQIPVEDPAGGASPVTRTGGVSANQGFTEQVGAQPALPPGFIPPGEDITGGFGAGLNAAGGQQTPQQQAQQLLQQVMGSPLFDQDGNPIIIDFPQEILDQLQGSDALEQLAELLIVQFDARTRLQEQTLQQQGQLAQTQAGANPFGRTGGEDAALQALLARGGLTPEQILTLTQAQFNPFGQSAADMLALTQTQFNPFGLGASDLLRQIQAQYNPFGFDAGQALNQTRLQFSPNAPINPFSQDQSIALQESLARGGLTAEQILQQIQAANQPQNVANMLGFIGNPSAVGTAVGLGFNPLGGSGQTLEGGSANPFAGFNLFQDEGPSSTGGNPFGGAQPASAPFSPLGSFRGTPSNPNLNTLRDFSDEELMFVQGQAAARGQTPSAFGRRARATTPAGR